MCCFFIAVNTGRLPGFARRTAEGGCPHMDLLAPALEFRPELGEGAEFWAAADVDVDLFFQGIGIVGGLADVLDTIPKLFETFATVVEDDHTVAGIAARSPEKPGLVAAEGRRQSVAAPEEVDGAGLAVVLGEDAAGFICSLVRGKAIPRYGSFGNDFFPSELIGVPLGQGGTGVAVFHDRKLEGKIFHVGEEKEPAR